MSASGALGVILRYQIAVISATPSTADADSYVLSCSARKCCLYCFLKYRTKLIDLLHGASAEQLVIQDLLYVNIKHAFRIAVYLKVAFCIYQK